MNMKHAQKKPSNSSVVISDPAPLESKIEYDSLHPEESVKAFLAFARSAKARYEENERLREECDAQTQDLLHFIEMSDNLNAANGYGAYKKLAEVRRTRRACKNENDLLKPFYDYYMAHRDMESQLARIQGGCRTTKEAIGNKRYGMRTNIMSERKTTV